MAIPFSRSLRALDSEQPGAGSTLQALLGVFTVIWCIWFFCARVRVTAIANAGRIEATERGHPIQPIVHGYVIAVHEELGRTVSRGDVLLELDATTERYELARRRAEQRALELQRDALEAEAEVAARAVAAQREASLVHVEEAHARSAQADGLLRFREEERTRSVNLQSAGVLSEVEVARRVAETEQQQAEVGVMGIAARRIRADQSVSDGERVERLAALRHELTVVGGSLSANAAAIEEDEHELDKRLIRAPVSGRIGEVLPTTIGAFVHEGEELGTVVPDGELRIVANFAPSAALGRIQPGQSGRMQLTGFPWTQYGAVSGTVVRVAEELRDGLVRVELSIADRAQLPIHLQHGLPGTVEIEIERASPAALVWRAAGGRLGWSGANR
jgi:multidrug resistance efflux pump